MTTTSSRVQRGPTYRPAPPRETNYIGKHRARDGHWFCAGHFIQIEVMGDPE